jgi:hypothetical protein
MDLLPEATQIALKHFLKRYYRNPWMRNEVGWKEAASIIASAQGQFNDFHPKRILYCGRKGFLCGDHRNCRRCAVDKRIEPAQEEYGRALGTESYWYFVVASSEVNPNKAGLQYVQTESDPLRFRPWIGKEPGKAIQGTIPDEAAFLSLAKSPFEFCALLTKKKAGERTRKGAGGAYCVLEFDVRFRPAARNGCGDWFGIHCDILPHCNIVINFPFPLTFEVAKVIYDAYAKTFLHQATRTSYPDLWIKPIISQADLNSRLSYSMKAWPIQKWHRRARLNGCDPERLDAIFDNIIFGDLTYLASLLKSPRKFGNMSCNSSDYIGVKPPLRLSRKQIDKWCKDPAFAALHADWELSVYRWIEKRLKRRGKRRKRKSDSED